MDKIKELKFIIQRLDQAYNIVNFKGTFFLGINTFILGGCITSLNSVLLNSEGMIWVHINFIIVVLFSILSVVFVLLAILPFLNTGNSYDYESRVFFGSIAKTDFKKFNLEIHDLDEKKYMQDLSRQTYILSKELKNKFIRIRNAGIVLFLSILSTIPFFYQILN